MFTDLSRLASVSLGYKSLQNNFFYLNMATIQTYGIERKYLSPILMMKDMDSTVYRQVVKPSLWMFSCRDSLADLRGTAALRYIQAMASRPAAEKKQTGKIQTIKEALEAQGSGLWYSPKARPSNHNIWLRKAFGGVFSPFLFDKATLVDQRCNSLKPLPGIEWPELAAVLTSSIFGYSLEINGASSMGAGALEAPTTKLRSYPVLNIAELEPIARNKIVALAKAVWDHEHPIDWSVRFAKPGPFLRKLDQFCLDISERDVKLDLLYSDLNEVCCARIAVANDKDKKTKKKHTDNIGNVANSIASVIIPKIQIKVFPDDFLGKSPLDMNFNIDRRTLGQTKMSRLLASVDLEILTNMGRSVFESTLPDTVAEGIVRCLLWGRSIFSVSSDAKAMGQALSQFLNWGASIERDINRAITESALGTGYEQALKREIYSRLGIHPLALASTLPSAISFASEL